MTKKSIDKHGFYFETPAYTMISVSQIKENLFDGDVDAYSARNSSETTYSISKDGIDTWWPASEGRSIGFYLIILKCKRKNNDTIRFVVYESSDVIFKIGQHPSLADLQFTEIEKKYGKVLPKEDLKNLKKAVALAAHGTGAGSFVYLRRIFENLIYENFLANKDSLDVSASDFKKLKMLSKIQKLKKFLPTQLLEMKGVYKILGKGVHELTEEECLRYFRPIKLSIELILDQKIEEKRKQDQNKKVKAELQFIHQEISTKDKE